MDRERLGILETYRLLNRDPVSFYRYVGHSDEIRFRRILFGNFTSITDPEHIRHVLVANASNYRKTPIGRALLEPILGRGLLTSEGDFWRRQRRIAQPAFHHSRVRAFADIMADAADEMLGRWAAKAAAGDEIEVQSEMSHVTMQIIARAMFSTGLAEDDVQRVGDAIRALNVDRLQLRDLLGVPEWLPRRLRPATRDAIAVVDNIVDRIIAERRGQNGGTEQGDRGDLLGMFMAARDDETGEGMTDRQLRDEVRTMFVAGHETTATALTWTFYALEKYPEVARRLFAEVDAGIPEGRAGFDDLAAMPYTRRVIEETMRLYPVVPQIARQAIAADEIAGTRVPPHAVVNILIWLVHRNPKYWDDPETFDPDRFLPERAAGRPKLAYLPFGGGGRICIGAGFAMQEAHIILAMVAKAYRLRLRDGYAAHPIGNVVLRPEGGLPMTIEPRGGPAPVKRPRKWREAPKAPA